MTPPTRRKLLYATSCVLVVVVARASLSLALIHDGFRALSDDDFSRVVIAQQFAARPSGDPSQTSWLPFPFWLYGTLMTGLGSSLAVARSLGFAIGLASSALLWVTARTLGLSRATSLVGTLVAMCVPYSACLGLTTTPDVYAAALILFACASLTRKNLLLRALGATALLAASLSRYEAWPVALLWALFTGRDALRRHGIRFALLVPLVLAGPLLWMVHGSRLHGSALFFIERVTSYQHALGGVDHSAIGRRLGTPWRLFVDAPELWVFVITVVVTSRLRGTGFWQRRWARPLVCLVGLAIFLCIGDWNGSTATHHTGRTLLGIWNLLSLMGAAGLASLTKAAASRSRHRARVLTGALGCILIAALVVRARASCRGLRQVRAEEVAIGLDAAARVPKGERLAIDTPDYGYFAVQAAFARPLETSVLDTHDPRDRTRVELRSSATNRLELARRSARWIVARRADEQLVAQFANVRRRGPTLVFAELQ